MPAFTNWRCSRCGEEQAVHSFQCESCGAARPESDAETAGLIPEPLAKKPKVDIPPPGDDTYHPFPFALVGKTVMIRGLEKKPELNGTKGIVQDFDAAANRYTVEVGANRTFKLKPENLQDLAPVSAASPVASEGSQAPLVGKLLEVQGLTGKPELNGTRGVVKEFDAAANRYTIDIENGVGTFKLKPDNLKEIAVPPQMQPPPQGQSGDENAYWRDPNNPGMVVKSINIAANQKGVVIGAGGAEIKRVRQESRAEVKVEDSTDNWEVAKVNIKGSMLQVDVAEKMVQELLAAAGGNKATDASNGSWGASGGSDTGSWSSPSNGGNWNKSQGNSSSWSDWSKGDSNSASKNFGGAYDSAKTSWSTPGWGASNDAGGSSAGSGSWNSNVKNAKPFEKKPCTFFLAGNCGYGDECTFLHDPALLAGSGTAGTAQAWNAQGTSDSQWGAEKTTGANSWGAQSGTNSWGQQSAAQGWTDQSGGNAGANSWSLQNGGQGQQSSAQGWTDPSGGNAGANSWSSQNGAQVQQSGAQGWTDQSGGNAGANSWNSQNGAQDLAPKSGGDNAWNAAGWNMPGW